MWELWLADVIHIWYERKHFKAFCIARLTQGRDRICSALRRRADDAQVSNLAPFPCFLPAARYEHAGQWITNVHRTILKKWHLVVIQA